jgi:hypothetical protein
MVNPFPLFVAVAAMLSQSGNVQAQFVDQFDGPTLERWLQVTGDGTPTMNIEQRDGFIRYHVDGSTDQHGVWWTFIKRDITASLDMQKLKDPAYELRVEARVRASHAPRRVNFMINTQRTTDYHEHLREYELGDTTQWHTISMTTRNFDAVPGDTVFVQFCVTDWGPGQYYVDVDYYRADVVRRDRAKPDVGEPLIYHPPVPAIERFAHHFEASHDSVINRDFPEVNFDDWSVHTQAGRERVLTVSGNQWIVMRWDLEALAKQKAQGAGVLELTTHSLAIGGDYVKGMGKDLGEEFPKIRVIEILGGQARWDQREVTYESLLQGQPYESVFNTQMTIDLELGSKPGDKAFFTLPRPVMQRLLEGKTKGLLIRPLGALSGSVLASESTEGDGPTLHFTTAQ